MRKAENEGKRAIVENVGLSVNGVLIFSLQSGHLKRVEH